MKNNNVHCQEEKKCILSRGNLPKPIFLKGLSVKNLFLLLFASVACNSTFAQVLERNALDKIKDCDTSKYDCDTRTKVSEPESIYPFFLNVPKRQWPIRIVYSVKPKQQELAYVVEETVITQTTKPDEVRSTSIKLVKQRNNDSANWEFVPK